MLKERLDRVAIFSNAEYIQNATKTNEDNHLFPIYINANDIMKLNH